MKKTITAITAIFLVIGTMMLTGCQKSNDLAPASHPENNLQIVPDDVALSVAENFNPATFFDEKNPTNHYPVKSTLTGSNQIKEKFKFNDAEGNPALYIFNFENGGFLFVSGDYQLQPVLAFVQTGEFKKDKAPSGVIQWVEKTMEDIEIVRKGLYNNSRTALTAWDIYVKQTKMPLSVTSKIMPPPDNPCDPEPSPQTTTVGPLLPVTWGQACTYNELCPNTACNFGCGTGNAWTGCVATSTAQIVDYWHPNNGYAYNYAGMPATIGNGEVQRLMRDIGLPVNANMSYGCDGSGADGSRVPGFLKARFGFTSANFSDYNSNYQKVQNNLSAHWPVLLDGCRTKTGHWFIINWWSSYSDCHEWACDGYQETSYTYCDNGVFVGGATYLYFHMNWGWHESWGGNDYNGWFAFNSWNIAGLNRNYQYAQDLTSEIHP
jgi:hypothetical protein